MTVGLLQLPSPSPRLPVLCLPFGGGRAHRSGCTLVPHPSDGPPQPSVGPLCHLGSDRPLAGLAGWAASSAGEEKLGLWATPFLKLPVSTRKAPKEEAGAPRADLRVHACVPQDQAREGAPRAPRAAGTGEHGFKGVHRGELGRGAGATGPQPEGVHVWSCVPG